MYIIFHISSKETVMVMKSDFHVYGWVRKISYCFHSDSQFLTFTPIFWHQGLCEQEYFSEHTFPGSILSNAVYYHALVPQWVLVGACVIKSERILLQPTKGGLPCWVTFTCTWEPLWGGLSLADTLFVCSLSLERKLLTPLHLGIFGLRYISTSQHFCVLVFV